MHGKLVHAAVYAWYMKLAGPRVFDLPVYYAVVRVSLGLTMSHLRL